MSKDTLAPIASRISNDNCIMCMLIILLLVIYLIKYCFTCEALVDLFTPFDGPHKLIIRMFDSRNLISSKLIRGATLMKHR